MARWFAHRDKETITAGPEGDDCAIYVYGHVAFAIGRGSFLPIADYEGIGCVRESTERLVFYRSFKVTFRTDCIPFTSLQVGL